MRTPAFVATLGAFVMLTACHTPERRPVAENAPDAKVVASVAPAMGLNDRTQIRASAQAGGGAGWGISSNGRSRLRWQGDGWEKVDSASELPRNVMDLVADPTRPS